MTHDSALHADRIAVFDGLRGVAAIAVVIFHQLFFVEIDVRSLYGSLVLAGASGVQIFFVLSGFFISGTLRDSIETRRYPIRDFIVRRILRIMPLWILLLLFMACTHQIRWPVFFANVIFDFGDYHVGSRWMPVVIAWSLLCEMCFYAFAALFGRLLVKMDFGGMVVFWLITLMASAMWQTYAVHHLGFEATRAAFFPMSQFPYFIAGFGIELALRENRRIENWLSTGQIRLLEILVLAHFALRFMPGFMTFPLELLAPAIAILCACPLTLTNRILKRREIAWFGLGSYGIYILQDQMSILAFKIAGQSAPGLTRTLTVLLAISAGLISYYTIERPILKWGRRFTSHRLNQTT